MPAPGDLLIVHLLEDMPIGETFERAHWPLHTTLIPWFQANDRSRLHAVLEAEAQNVQPFQAVVGREEMFGINRDIPVNVIADQAPIKALHQSLTKKLLQVGVELQENQWMGENYRAHISHMDSGVRRHHEGDMVTIGNFCLAQLMTPSTCQILQIYNFGSG